MACRAAPERAAPNRRDRRVSRSSLAKAVDLDGQADPAPREGAAFGEPGDRIDPTRLCPGGELGVVAPRKLRRREDHELGAWLLADVPDLALAQVRDPGRERRQHLPN